MPKVTDPSLLAALNGPRQAAPAQAAPQAPNIKMSDEQSKRGLQARLMRQAEIAYTDAINAGYDPTSARNWVASIFEDAPKGVGEGIGTLIRNDVSDRGRQAENLFTEAFAKAMTGAQSSLPEEAKYPKMMFTRPGQNFNTFAPQARAAREAAFEGAASSTGAGREQIGRFPSNLRPSDQGGSPQNAFDLSGGQSRTTIPVGSFYRDPQGNIRRNLNEDRGNPIVQKAARANAPQAAPSGGVMPRKPGETVSQYLARTGG